VTAAHDEALDATRRRRDAADDGSSACRPGGESPLLQCLLSPLLHRLRDGRVEDRPLRRVVTRDRWLADDRATGESGDQQAHVYTASQHHKLARCVHERSPPCPFRWRGMLDRSGARTVGARRQRFGVRRPLVGVCCHGCLFDRGNASDQATLRSNGQRFRCRRLSSCCRRFSSFCRRFSSGGRAVNGTLRCVWQQTTFQDERRSGIRSSRK
jgi:hypothetical protein